MSFFNGREQEGGMAEFVARSQEMILDLEDPSMAIVNDEILTNFLFFQSYQVNKFTTYDFTYKAQFPSQSVRLKERNLKCHALSPAQC